VFLDRSLAAKILVAFAIVVLVGIGGVALLANDRTTVAFERYLQGSGPDNASQLASVAALLYGQTGSWSTVNQVFAALPGPPDQRVIVVDASGAVVVDSLRGRGESTASLGPGTGQPIVVNGATVGTLFVTGFGNEDRSRRGSELFGFSDADRAFLTQVNQSILLAALAAIFSAFILGVLLARQIIRPLRQLTRVARRIAHGHLDERITVRGHDEVAELGAAFNQMAESLQRTEEARRQLVADVAHELRTPLMVVGATVEAIQDGVLPANPTNLQTIRDEVASLGRLVSDLRDLSLGDVGQFLIERAAVDLADVLESVGTAFQPAAAANGVTLVVEVDPGLSRVSGDEARLRQCLRNLVDNALRHTPRGGTVSLRGRAAGDAVTVEVADTGEGIAPEQLPRIFDRFFRADPSRARQSGGTGLGLAIVRQIVQAHGGDVSVASDGPGRGSTFTIRLPALLPHAARREEGALSG
jgi:signal transduction histidine kinase